MIWKLKISSVMWLATPTSKKIWYRGNVTCKNSLCMSIGSHILIGNKHSKWGILIFEGGTLGTYTAILRSPFSLVAVSDKILRTWDSSIIYNQYNDYKILNVVVSFWYFVEVRTRQEMINNGVCSSLSSGDSCMPVTNERSIIRITKQCCFNQQCCRI